MGLNSPLMNEAQYVKCLTFECKSLTANVEPTTFSPIQYDNQGKSKEVTVQPRKVQPF